MIFQYLKIALRNMIRAKVFSFINILSLSSGIMFCLLIFYFTKQEFSHDEFHKKADRIYRVVSKYSDPEGGFSYSTLHDYKFVDAFRNNISSVTNVTALKKSVGWIRYKDKIFNEEIAFVDSTFYKIFSFQFLAGDKRTALNDLNNVVVTKSVAEKFFGIPENSYNEFIGKMLLFPKGKEKNFVVTGIIDDIPPTSSIDFSMTIPYANEDPYPESNNYFGNSSIYVELNSSDNQEEAEASIPPIIDNILGEKMEKAITYYFKEGDNPFFEMFFQPITSMYLDEDIGGEYENAGSAKYSYILASIAVLVLIISCINYIMLTSGQSVQRIKEVGMRKVLGARNWNIHKQYLTEAALISFLSLLFGILLSHMIMPLFNQLSDRQLTLSLFEPDALVFILVLLMLVSFIVGIIPGLRISTLNPAHIFRKNIKWSGKNKYARFFVIAQFTLCIILVIATFIILRQLNYLRVKDTGFNKEQVIVISIPDEFSTNQVQTLQQQLVNHSSIISTSGSDRNFIWGSSSDDLKNKNGQFISVRFLRIEPGYLETLGIALLEGRNFSYSISSDTSAAVLVNETFVKAMDWDQVIGVPLPVENDGEEAPVVVGIVKDFHFDSMHKKIEPLVLHMNSDFNQIWNVFVKFDKGRTQEAIASVNESWNLIAPGRPLNYVFLNDSLKTQYDKEERWSKIVGYAAIFTILLSSLGLLGLTLLIVTRRTKEIGIRKAIGASAGNIMVMISKDFAGWILIALIIATPFAIYVMQKWLQGFAYKATISWWIILFAGIITMLIAVLTVSIHTIKAAFANPVNALRYE